MLCAISLQLRVWTFLSLFIFDLMKFYWKSKQCEFHQHFILKLCLLQQLPAFIFFFIKRFCFWSRCFIFLLAVGLVLSCRNAWLMFSRHLLVYFSFFSTLLSNSIDELFFMRFFKLFVRSFIKLSINGLFNWSQRPDGARD